VRLDKVIDELLATQDGVVATWQLRNLGATATEIARLRQRPEWEAAGRRVSVLRSTPATVRRTARVALLEAGPHAYLSHETSAAVWDLGASYRLVPPQIMVARGEQRDMSGTGRNHPLTAIGERWLTVHDGFPVVRPELCVYQLCGTVHPDRAERALDTAWSKGLVSGASLRACLLDHAGHGRNGTVVLRSLLEARGSSYVPPATGLEARFAEIVRPLGEFRRQVDSGGELWAGRVDFRHAAVPLVVEVQSERYHASLSSQQDDALRRARLEAAGFAVVEVWDTDIWHNTPKIRAVVRRGLLRFSSNRLHVSV
jgi:very-short-patch-repair endonuclease